MRDSFISRCTAANQDPKAFAAANIHADSKLGKMCRLAYVLQGHHGTLKNSMKVAGDKRSAATKLYQIG